MQSVTNKQASTSYLTVGIGASYPSLEAVTRPTVDTAAAAYYLNRQQQTLRGWACFDNGPIRPLRICGRLAWPVQRIKELTGVEV